MAITDLTSGWCAEATVQPPQPWSREAFWLSGFVKVMSGRQLSSSNYYPAARFPTAPPIISSQWWSGIGEMFSFFHCLSLEEETGKVESQKLNRRKKESEM